MRHDTLDHEGDPGRSGAARRRAAPEPPGALPVDSVVRLGNPDGAITPRQVATLQRTAGNRAVTGLLLAPRQAAVHPAVLDDDALDDGPLDRGSLDDAHERAAERLGDHIFARVAGPLGLAASSPGARPAPPAPMALSARAPVARTPVAPRALPAPRPLPLPAAPSVQRYQAGEMGHGGIEAEALAAAGFGGDMGSGEIGAIYFGNWARDLSQLPHSWAAQEILQTLAWGEFGHGIDLQQLGGYLASEHLDNPAGGTSPESGVPVNPSMGLSAEQQAAVAEEATAAYTSMIAARAAASGLPDYIERGKEHAKRKLREAVRKPRDPNAMFALGNALHAMEDYYSHSNFIEVAFSILVGEGTVDPKKPPWSEYLKRQTRFGYDAVAAGGKDRFGREQIISGTYAAGPNDQVSRLELLQTEMTNGALRRALFLGYFRRFVARGGEMGRSALEPVGRGGGAIVGGTLGAIAGGAWGALSGGARGFSSGRGVLGTVTSTIGGAFGGGVGGALSGGAAGASTGARIGGETLGGAGEAMGGVLGGMTGATIMTAALGWVGGLFAVALAAARKAADSGKLEQLADEQTDKAQAQAASSGLGLTHSALAKDAPEHPLFGASRQLAVEMDKAIGKAVKTAWAEVDLALGGPGSAGEGPAAGGSQGTPQAGGATPNPAVEAAADTVADLVDKYIVHPRANDWWKPIVAAEAARVAAAAGGGGSGP